MAKSFFAIETTQGNFPRHECPLPTSRLNERNIGLNHDDAACMNSLQTR